MKIAIVLTAITLAALFPQGDANREKLVKENLKAIDDVTAILKAVKDKDTAEIVVPKLEEAMKRLDAAYEAAQKVPANDLAKLNKTYAKEIKAAYDALAAEDGRLQKLPEVQKILFKSPSWAWAKYNAKVAPIAIGIAEADVKKAKLDLISLDQAIKVHYIKKGYYPETLAVLAERDPIDNSPAIIANKEVLIDPWGNPYVYDLKSFHPQTDIPLIYCNGPPGGNLRLTNWDARDK